MRTLRLLGLLLGVALIAGCPDGDMDQAKTLAARGEYEASGERFFGIAKTDPANLAAWDGAVDAFCVKEVRVGRCMAVLDLELELLGTLERHQDALGVALEQRARARIDQGLVEAGLADLDRAERAAPNRASIRVARARALVMQGRREAALQNLYRAKEIDPNNAEADVVFKLVPGSEPDEPEVPEDDFGGESR